MSVSLSASPVQAEDCEPTADDRSWLASFNATWEPPDVPGEPLLPFAERLEVDAAWFRSHGTSYGDFVAGLIGEAAHTARFLGAKSPDDYIDRLKVQEAWAAERLEVAR